MASSHRPANTEVIAKIEAIFENIADSLLGEENPNVPRNDIFVPVKYKKRAPHNTDTRSTLDAEPSDDFTKVCFPARGRPKEAWRFTVLVRILELMHEALYDNVIISKRNIYYKDPALFKNQLTVDYYVDIIAYTFGVSRLALNVTAAAKGLVAGNFILKRPDGTQVHNKPDVSHLVDDAHDIQAIDISDVEWILVVEKESTFRTLVSCNLHQSSRAGNGMILTAKGYPDMSTRSFLRLLSVSHNHDCIPPPIYALTDFDPDGLAIMSTYKHGSFKLSHENAGLNVPSIQWLGIQSRDVLAGNGGDEYDGLLRLSARDRKKAADMLQKSEVLQENGQETEWRRELQVMLMLNVKAEMEVLAEKEGGVERWVEEKLLENGASSHADEDLVETTELADMTLGEGDFPRLHENEEKYLLDTHETPETSAVGDWDEELLETNQLADMTLGEEISPSLHGDDDECLLDTHSTPEISGFGEASPSLQADENLLDTHEQADMLPAEWSPSTQLDEDLPDTYRTAEMSLAEEGSPSWEWDEEL